VCFLHLHALGWNAPLGFDVNVFESNDPEEEVRSSFSAVAPRVESVRSNLAQAAAEVRRGTEQLMARARQQLPLAAERVQEGATTAAWVTFFAMVISLIAIGGAMVGRRQAARRVLQEDTRRTSVYR